MSTTSFLHSFASQVFLLLKGQKVQERGIQLLGKKVCQKGFRVLLGIGKHRFGRLRQSAIKEEVNCPTDLRFRPRRNDALPANSVRPQITEFLNELYNTTAEPLPEAHGFGAGAGQAKKSIQNVRRRGKRPRHLHKFDSGTKFKGHLPDAKFLPPGSIGDYLDLCRARYPHLSIGRKIFCRDSWMNLSKFQRLMLRVN